ncbi:MAG: hypothetical protein K9J13_15580, partial [Saprospiraceae bacterium]|nr:hypothetical protein [Saprospiraceae bacterium]
NIFKKNDTVVVEEEVVEDVVLSDYESGDEIFMVVETPPKYVGGDEAKIKFLQNNIRYPEKALENGIQGTCLCDFCYRKGW